jgi:hypothetical protein
MKARWPATGCAVDAAALEQYEALKQLVRGVRNARLEYGLEQARKVSVAVFFVRLWWRFLGFAGSWLVRGVHAAQLE